MVTNTGYTQDDFEQGDPVRYIPNQADGDVNHPACQNGRVSFLSVASMRLVFVRYWDVNRPGEYEFVSKGTAAANLIKL